MKRHNNKIVLSKILIILNSLSVASILSCNKATIFATMQNEYLESTKNSVKSSEDDNRPYLYSDHAPIFTHIGKSVEKIETALEKEGFRKVSCFYQGYAPLGINNSVLLKTDEKGLLEKAYFISIQSKDYIGYPSREKASVTLNSIIFRKNLWELPRPYLHNIYPDGLFNILSWRYVSSVMHTIPMVIYNSTNRPSSQDEEVLFGAIHKNGLENTITRILQKEGTEGYYDINIATNEKEGKKIHAFTDLKRIINNSLGTINNSSDTPYCECTIY